MTTENEKSPAPEQASEARRSAETAAVRTVTAEAIVEQHEGTGNETSSKFGDAKSRADALTDKQREAIEFAARWFDQSVLPDTPYSGYANALRELLAASPVEQPAAASAAERFVVIGYGESDIPEAKIVGRREDLLDAVLGMIYGGQECHDDAMREEYAQMLADDDQWSVGGWEVKFEIGGIQVWRVALSRSPTMAAEAVAQRYFVYCQESGYREHATDAERDKDHRKAIKEYLDPVDRMWCDGVESVVSGIVTHVTGKVNAESAPAQCTAHPEQDGDGCEDCDAWNEWPDHSVDETCDYVIAPVAAPQPTAQSTTDEANGVTLDRRDLFDFARGAIKSALVDYKAGEGMTATWYWQEATNRAEALLEALDTKSPHIEAARVGESR
ncbi:hypothetical protein WT15_23750 [Burkholderia stagnalis]|uniref:hypothetical protein n=1 Tax=Burkholderia stagnalis TaxID=1503054 RepID=UPI00075B167C|nr:hypothetical protein [Burkholderia stagnalis]KVN73861.1 hypothetical protein WT15_23750 [Burkholderia stagnalis]KWO27033.1 hypothetical protein WT96_31140 [Burkholderia stagnalis]KWO45031.1 hypothetical protein WT95_26785 [Burkholderia stagnalis]